MPFSRMISARSASVGSFTRSAPPSPEVARKSKVQDLKRALNKAQFETLTELPAAQALEQLQQNQERMTSFERTLSLKLSPNEITYGRYHDAAQQVYLAILNQLNEIATRLTNVLSIKVSEDPTDANTEASTRLLLRGQELAKVSAQLKLNESALTRMDQLTQAISEMKNQSAIGTSDLAPLLLELEDLAERAKKY